LGKPPGVWTLELAAEVSFAKGLTAERVSDETVRRSGSRRKLISTAQLSLFTD
jgi:hypothetical protein